ncbi:MAG: hypothetical protein ACRD4T_07410 [Candidatus Acidiferrales bacterium]
MRFPIRLLLSLSVPLLLLATSLPAREPEGKPEDASKKLIQDMHRLVREEASRFVAAGGKRSDTSHPYRTWAPLFWRYYELHRGALAAGEAAEASFMMFQGIGKHDEIIA